MTVGVLAMEHIAAGLVDGNRIVGPVRTYPPASRTTTARCLLTLPEAEIADARSASSWTK